MVELHHHQQCQRLQQPKTVSSRWPTIARCRWQGLIVLFGLAIGINWLYVNRITRPWTDVEDAFVYPTNNKNNNNNGLSNSTSNSVGKIHQNMSLLNIDMVNSNPEKKSIRPSSEQSDRLRLHHDNNVTTELDETMLWANKSTVDYFACCGAGHRLSRTANAYYVARRVMNFGFRVYWRFCRKVELYHYLFGPQPLEELRNVTSMNQVVSIHNNVPGFVTLYRLAKKKNRPCPCKRDKIESDVEFYSSLQQRYRFKRQLDQFIQENFASASLRIGLHIRAGNNETGDFAMRGRGIQQVDEWVQLVASHVRQLFLTWTANHTNNSTTQHKSTSSMTAVLFLASDTPSMLYKIRSLLANDTFIHVVDYPQIRPAEGKGVLFGESPAAGLARKTDACLLSWQAIFADMMLLSQVDILVAPRSSSFTQTLPMSLVFANRERKVRFQSQQQQQQQQNLTVPPAFCEMNLDASVMTCFNTYMQWCCEVHNSVGELIQLPEPSYEYKSSPRETSPCLPKPHKAFPGYCLPFRWPPKMQLPWNITS